MKNVAPFYHSLLRFLCYLLFKSISVSRVK